MKRIKKTKIIATIGPSSSSSERIEKLIKEGVDVLRINFSHSSHKEAGILIKEIRKLNQKLSTNTSILADLQGPKLRIGEIKSKVTLIVGNKIKIKTGKKFTGDDKMIFVNYQSLPSDINIGEKILIDDGKIILKVLDSNTIDEISAEIIQGGDLLSNKGFNLPNTDISQPALTEKDIEDAMFSAKQEVDWIALSFVRHESDIKSLIKLLEKNTKHRIPVIAKIEKPEGVKNIDDIMKHASGIMVARGDLGVEINAAEVPLIQKKLVNKAKKVTPQLIRTMPMKASQLTRINYNDLLQSNNQDAMRMQQKIENMRALPKIVSRTKVGKSVELEVWRNRNLIKKKLILGRLESSAEFQQEKKTKKVNRSEEINIDSLKIVVRDISDTDIEKRKLKLHIELKLMIMLNYLT